MTLIDSQIGSYKIKKIIGQRLFSTVCLATDTVNIRDVVLKVFVQDTADSETRLERFTQEAQNAERFDHPNILSFHETGEASGEQFIAFEFVTERTLSNYLDEQEYGVLPIDDTIGIIRQIAAALDYLHDQGFIHRNITPDTFLYTEDGRILISDFSLARNVNSKDTRSIITIAGSSIGALDYISPEQAEGEIKIDRRSDIYSLAVLAYQLCSNKLPHSAPSPHELLHQIVYEKPPSLERIVPDIPAGISYAIDRALSKDIPMRYGKATSFADALEEGKTWEPSPTAYKFLAEATRTVQNPAASQVGNNMPNAEFNAQMHQQEMHQQMHQQGQPERKQSKMPLLLSILVGLIGLSIASLYFISQQANISGAFEQSTGDTGTAAGSKQTTESANDPDADPFDAVLDNIIKDALDDTNQDESMEAGQAEQVDANEPDVEQEDLTGADPEWLAPYSRYRDPENRFLLEVPALWSRNVSAKSVNFDSRDPFARIFVRNMGTSDPDRSAEALIQQYINDNANSFNNLALVENSNKRTESGYFQQEYGAVWLNKEVTLDLIAINGEDQSYILGLVAGSDINAEISSSFEKIVASFSLNTIE